MRGFGIGNSWSFARRIGGGGGNDDNKPDPTDEPSKPQPTSPPPT